MTNSKGNNINRQHEGQGHSEEPHPRDGHIRVPNEVVDRLAKLQASGAEWQIIFATWRRTLGWQHSGEWRNEPYPISLGDLSKATGLNRRYVAREVKDLVERNILKRTAGERKHLLCFNLDYTTWVVSKRTLVGSGEIDTSSSVQIDTSLVSKQTLPSDTKLKLLNKPKETYKETGVPPTTTELKILDILRELKGWRYDEADDLAWLRPFTQEFPDFNLAELRAAREYYSGWPPPRHQGAWKTRLRNWMRKNLEFGRRTKRPHPRGKPTPSTGYQRFAYR